MSFIFKKDCLSHKYQALLEASCSEQIGFAENFHLSTKIDYH